MNAVIYARYSSFAQTEQSIEGQLRVCHEFAEKQGCNIIGEYIDRAKTGTNADRPEFQRMIEDSKNKLFQFVIVYKLDRFSRNKYDSTFYKHALELNDVRVLSATEIISNSPEGMLMEGLLEMFAELYSKDLSQKVKRGMRENVIKGLAIGGKPLYGYKIEDKKYVINEDEAPAVRYMFEQYANGMKKRDIIKNLNEMGYRTSKGKKFKENSLQNNFSNEKYTGIYKNKYTDGTEYYPAIIDKETFDKVQERLKHNKRYSGISKENYLLSGKVYCGYCGASMIGMRGTSHTGEPHAYYVCLEKRKRHNCKKANENKQELEDFIINFIRENVMRQGMAEIIAKRIVKSYKTDINESTIKDFERRIKANDKELDKITDQFLQTDSKELKKKLEARADDLGEQNECFQKQIDKLKLAIKVRHIEQDLTAQIKFFVAYCEDEKEEEKTREKIIDTLVSSVYVFDDDVHIYLNFNDHNQKMPFDQVQDLEQKAQIEFAHQMNWCGERIKART